MREDRYYSALVMKFVGYRHFQLPAPWSQGQSRVPLCLCGSRSLIGVSLPPTLHLFAVLTATHFRNCRSGLSTKLKLRSCRRAKFPAVRGWLSLLLQRTQRAALPLV